jgi:hypothetical protein
MLTFEKQEVVCDKCMDHGHSRSFPLTPALVGKTLAYTSIKFMNEKGIVFARGSHTKLVTAFSSLT